jgi:3-oxoadipate enol-lactonase
MLISLGSRRLHYDLIGSETGRAVCLAHALAADSGMWSEQIPTVLAAGRRVLRIDMRGHGGSDAVPGDYTLKELAADIVAVLDATHMESVDYVGLSIGGMIGEAFALDHPLRVSSLLLCETPPASLKNAKEVWGPRVAAVQKAASLEPIADATLGRWLTPDFSARRPARWRQIRDTVAATSVAGYCGAVAALSKFDFSGELHRVGVPALVLYGEEDRATSHEENQRLASLIPGGRFVSFAGARHLPNVEDPARFNAILGEWLACA